MKPKVGKVGGAKKVTKTLSEIRRCEQLEIENGILRNRTKIEQELTEQFRDERDRLRLEVEKKRQTNKIQIAVNVKLAGRYLAAKKKIKKLQAKVNELAQLLAPAGQGEAVRVIDDIISENERVRAELRGYEAFLELAANDTAFVGSRGDLCICCSDTFAYACADAESFPVSEWLRIKSIYDEHGYDGLVALIALKRQQEPLPEVRDEKYMKARKALEKNK